MSSIFELLRGMDATAYGILLGVVGTAPWLVLHHYRKDSDPDLAAILTVFVGIFSLPIAAVAIFAAFKNDPSLLPSKWREYVASASLLGIYLTLKKAGVAYRGVLAQPAQTTDLPRPPSAAAGEAMPITTTPPTT